MIPTVAQVPVQELRSCIAPWEREMVELLGQIAQCESPTDDAASQEPVREILNRAWAQEGYAARYLPGVHTGGHVLYTPEVRTRGRPVQLMVGHMDTVWPRGTLPHMPVVETDGILRGPGVFDMKGGLVLMIFAVRALRATGLTPPATPVAFINSDEEVGSPESRHHVRRLAKASCRAFVLEPAYGLEGAVKTARKGVGKFEVIIRGKASHAGLDPQAGLSSILELSHVIQALHSLTDLERGLTVNVGVIEGGTRANVVAASSRAEVDVRALTVEDAEWVTNAIKTLEPEQPGVELEIRGGFEVPPLERTPRNRVLWEQVRTLGTELGLDLDEVTAGGGSDGNTTSQYTATLDGLGPRGDGAHADREHVVVESMVERAALLAGLLAAPLGRPDRD